MNPVLVGVRPGNVLLFSDGQRLTVPLHGADLKIDTRPADEDYPDGYLFVKWFWGNNRYRCGIPLRIGECTPDIADQAFHYALRAHQRYRQYQIDYPARYPPDGT
jgi:hypothetical protein